MAIEGKKRGFLEFVFENPLANAYSRMLRKFIGVANASQSVWLVVAFVIFVGYFADFIRQGDAFSGSLSASFVTARTAVPWLAYAIACFFLVPWFFELLLGDEVPSRSGSVSATGLVVMMAVLCTVFAPYGWLILRYRSFLGWYFRRNFIINLRVWQGRVSYLLTTLSGAFR